MNLTWFDWLIVAAVLAFMISQVVTSRKQMQSVADFLAAGRTAGRYVLSLSQGMAALGAISIIGNIEMNYVAGFTMGWWGLSTAVVVLFITATGWVIYRFRQTRALTLAQFFEMRYSRKFRIFAGLLAFLSGIINFGIFPAVGARFFIYFCGLPQTYSVFGVSISTFASLMILLLALALFFVFSGGQIAVIITDFIQGVFVNFVFIAIVLFLLHKFNWSHIYQALETAPKDASLINPFHTSHLKDFNFWYFLIGVIGIIYATMSWQGTQGYNASAQNAHEAKMAGMLSNWRNIPQAIFLLIIPIVAYTVLHHSDYSAIASTVNAILKGIPNETIQSQVRVPLVLTQILPSGFLGAFVAVMLAAFISTHDTYLHSWGSIFIQDVIMPFRGKPFKPDQHIRILKLSILGVAVFIFLFSLLFRQNQYIFLFFAITGAIFAGGSGAVIIGGLYWKRGTTAAAWWAMIIGSSIAVGGIILHQINPNFPVNGQWFWGIAMAASTTIYIGISLLQRKPPFNMDKLLHRGAYAIPDETHIVQEKESKGLAILGFDREFTRGDKLIYILTYIWIFGWTLVFVVGTIINLAHNVSDQTWMHFWIVNVWINVIMSVVVVLWFTIGGIIDLRSMRRRLDTLVRDVHDDGFIPQEEKEAAN